MKLSSLVEGYLDSKKPAHSSTQKLFERLPSHIPITPEKSDWVRVDDYVWRSFEFSNWELLSSFVGNLLSLIPMFSPKRKIDVEITDNLVFVKIICDKFTTDKDDREVARIITSLKDLQEDDDDDLDFI